MKKVLLASTALLLTAGVASAQSIEISGSANGGLKYNSEAADQLTIHNEVNMVFAATGTSDAGLEFGATIDLDESGVDDAEVFISGTFGTITVGDVDPATDGFGIADVGFDGIGMDDPAEALKNGTGSADLHYSYSISGITIMASLGVDNEDYAVAVEYDGGFFSVGAGYMDAAPGTVNLDELGLGDVAVPVNNSAITVVAGVSQGPLSANALYSDWTADGFGDAQSYGIDVSYDTGAATVTGVYSNLSSGGDSISAYGVGVSVPLGGGLAVAAGIGILDPSAGDSATVADAGVTMDF